MKGEDGKLLVVVDMQNDFVDGPLGTPEAQEIQYKVLDKIMWYQKEYGLDVGSHIIYTQDTHGSDYLETSEGKKLPVEHCIAYTDGWKVVEMLDMEEVPDFPTSSHGPLHIHKETFGYKNWAAEYLGEYEEIELVGVCTDICVVTNALLLKTAFPDVEITVDASCCAGTTPENHKAALQVMKSCQINVIGE